MKVIAINGSPKANGNTAQALQLVGDQLTAEGVEFEIIHVGNKLIRGCMGCGVCAKRLDERCTYDTDLVNETIQKMKEADGILLGTPVYYAGVAGTMKSFLDRVFYVSGVNGSLFRHKVGAAVVAVRRTGGSSTFDCLNHYLTYSEMLLPTSNYWNIIHGRTPGEIHEDEEGAQIMRLLGKNMAYLLKMKAQTTVEEPLKEAKMFTSFVR